MQDLLLITRRTFLPSPSRSRLRALVKKSQSMAARPGIGGDHAITPTLLRANKPIVLILGSGWAAHALIKVKITEACSIAGVGSVRAYESDQGSQVHSESKKP